MNNMYVLSFWQVAAFTGLTGISAMMFCAPRRSIINTIASFVVMVIAWLFIGVCSAYNIQQ